MSVTETVAISPKAARRASKESAYTVNITRKTIESGQATIMVPKGKDPAEVLAKMREEGDDFLDWDTVNISDLEVEITPKTEA